MPLYDFECAHGHRFEKMVRIADRNDPLTCEGLVNQMVTDELDEEGFAIHTADMSLPLPEGMFWQSIQISEDVEQTDYVIAKKVSCQLQATMLVTHAHPSSMLNHGFAANRDAAREGRYDPITPSTRTMSKGREWRK